MNTNELTKQLKAEYRQTLSAQAAAEPLTFALYSERAAAAERFTQKVRAMYRRALAAKIAAEYATR